VDHKKMARVYIFTNILSSICSKRYCDHKLSI